MRYGQIVMGPAGSGKSTYCSTMVKHCENIRRSVHVVNLDPAAEYFDYPVDIDIRELVHLDDVMEADDLRLGPNGGLIFCMEYLIQRMDWLQEQLGDGEDDYFLFDCPGQIELYTHIPVMRQIVDCLTHWDFRVCGVFLVDSQFLVDVAKLFSGAMTATAAMVQLEIPHINVMSKMDLLNRRDRRRVESYLELDTVSLMDELGGSMGPKYASLNRAMASVLDDYSLVRFIPLDSTSEESISDLLLQIDFAIQYGEDQEVRNADVNTNEEDDMADDG